MLLTLIFIYGLIIGSFGHAYVFRLREGKEKISEGRSKCDFCKHELAAKDLIPLLSWLSVGGKCRYCRRKLTKLHPIVEACSGLVFLAAALSWPHDLDNAWAIAYFVSWLLVLANLIFISLYDFLYMEIPIAMQKFNLLFCSALFGLGLHLGLLASSGLVDALLGATILFLLFLGLHNFSDGKWLGGADVYLIAPFGLVLGVLLGFVSIILASYVALGVIIIRSLFVAMKGNKKIDLRGRQIPFGPFLSAGFAIAFIYGQSIMDLIT